MPCCMPELFSNSGADNMHARFHSCPILQERWARHTRKHACCTTVKSNASRVPVSASHHLSDCKRSSAWLASSPWEERLRADIWTASTLFCGSFSLSRSPRTEALTLLDSRLLVEAVRVLEVRMKEPMKEISNEFFSTRQTVSPRHKPKVQSKSSPLTHSSSA